MAVRFLDTSHEAGESLMIWAKYRHACHADDMEELFSEVCEADGVAVEPVIDMDTPLEIYLPSMPAAA